MIVHSRLKGEYRMEVRRDGAVLQETPWFDNLILDQGLDRCGNAAGGILSFCHAGTGASTATVGQTSLDSWLASSTGRTATVTNLGSPNYEGRTTIQFTFTTGSVVGLVAEVGVGWASGSGSNLFSRARVVDPAGTPTSLSVTAADQLVVFYRLTVSTTLTDVSSSVVYSGTSYPYTVRPATVANFMSADTSYQSRWGPLQNNAWSTYPAGSALGPITGSPTGSPLGGTGIVVVDPYVTGSYYLDSTLTLGPTLGNSAGGVQCIVLNFGPQGAWQFRFDTPVPKNNVSTWTIPARFGWSR